MYECTPSAVAKKFSNEMAEEFMYGIQAQDFYVRKTTLQQRMLEQMRWIDDEED